ncbi:MAG: VWA domain-containing protein [Planctomycetia bacterium]|nr:VWA domain-containing protein [Planctomycetia bacterium]
MAVGFGCPNCSKQIETDAEAGSRLACPHCNTPVVVPEEEQPGGLDAVMSYLAAYLPSWGSSVVFHLALILLCIFLVWSQDTGYKPAEYTTGMVSNVPMKTVKRNVKAGPRRKGKSVSAESATSFALAKGKASAPKGNPMSPIAVSGTSGGAPAGIQGGTGTSFMGIEGGGGGGGGAKNIIFVIDSSGSMTDSIEYVKAELKRTIGDLISACRFHIIFFSAGKPREMRTRRLVPATVANKRAAYKFIAEIEAGNPYLANTTDPSEALRRAFELKPQLIYFLTDGEFDREIVSMISGWNRGSRVRINTISFIYRSGEKLLRQIARDNKGIYKFVSEEDLPMLAQ